MAEDKLGAFDFVNSISFNKTEFTDDEIQRYYDPYITVMAFANYSDTIFIANALNCFKSPLSKKNHFLFLYHIIRKRKRFSQFYKKEADRKKKAEIVSRYYDYSLQKAEEVLNLLSEEDLKYMNDYMNDLGGITKQR